MTVYSILKWWKNVAFQIPKLLLKGLSHEIDFKNFDKKLHNLA